MNLKDFILAVCEQNKKPEEIPGIKSIKKLDAIHDFVTLFFVERHKGLTTVSALEIEQYFPINREMGGVIKGEWKLGGYLEEEKCFYSLGQYPITRLPPNQTFVTQERLDTSEVYVEDILSNLFDR